MLKTRLILIWKLIQQISKLALLELSDGFYWKLPISDRFCMYIYCDFQNRVTLWNFGDKSLDIWNGGSLHFHVKDNFMFLAIPFIYNSMRCRDTFRELSKTSSKCRTNWEIYHNTVSAMIPITPEKNLRLLNQVHRDLRIFNPDYLQNFEDFLLTHI